MTETWKPIPDYEGSYEVSDQGRVRSVDRFVQVNNIRYGGYKSYRFGKVLKSGTMTGGHQSVALCRGNSRCVHELVLLAFDRKPNQGEECRHLNGDPSDNRLANLRWGTRSENIRDNKFLKPRTGNRLDATTIRAIRLDTVIHTQRGALTKIAKKYNTSLSTVSAIKNGRVHTDV